MYLEEVLGQPMDLDSIVLDLMHLEPIDCDTIDLEPVDGGPDPLGTQGSDVRWIFTPRIL